MKPLKHYVVCTLALLTLFQTAPLSAEGTVDAPVSTTDAPTTTTTTGDSTTANPIVIAVPISSTLTPDNELVLKKNSTAMLFNKKPLKAAQPLTIKNGSSYAALNGIAGPFGYKLSYDAKTKESIAKAGDIELRFKPGSDIIKRNGESIKGPGPTFILKGSLMVPLRMWSNLTGSRIIPRGIDTVISWAAPPSAEFTVQPTEIFAQQTVVDYLVNGVPTAVDETNTHERWEGRESIFQEAGMHVVTHWIQGENGVWSEPFSVTVNVQMPNQPPVADFTTDKTTYRIGEPVTYTDLSTDDRNDIISAKFTGNSPAFFSEGQFPVTLEVKDGEQLIGTVTKMITVIPEILYTEDEFNLLFTPVGRKYTMDGTAVRNYPTLSYTYTNEPARLVHSNSPERWMTTGLVYDTELSGATRFLFYNENGAGYPLKMYLVATNTSSTGQASVGVGAWGKGGPDKSTIMAGKMATIRYMDALTKNVPASYVTLAPGESKILLPEMSNVPVKPGDVFSAYADVVSTTNIRYRIVVVQDKQDPLPIIDSLTVMPRDNKHVRGTFDYADRVIDLSTSEPVGAKPQSILLGDSKIDKLVDGIDEMTGLLEYDFGNFGVLYKMKVQVAPNTIVGINARGGHYAGAFIVNGKLVPVTTDSALLTQNETAVLYRTGAAAETLDIVFTLASGSYLPINMTFLPMPQLRQ
ncbi:copper amine oxidase N-terminal domain-containing protein [Paenibacillus sp. BC26]|uniref:copper amine oxidase N-terminal domain-containing protein n=1 Tax=Paenibacillus sp. BC26 TaxID=1881032 RepID=UPI0008E9A14B|nr:copper amine oxidase N-terminal domain-containing protein [Paenibacillus sp. BC26]SFT10107.1 Copper amine oxidase N-terminal domain-containing protein [Paenibacillus sp. BC26]